ncbi:MAG: ATP-binding protein, partial [Myxococcota bacterium]
LVGAGWVMQSALLVQLRPDWTPLQPDVAAGLGLVGLGLILSARGREGLAAVVGLVTAPAAAVVLVQSFYPLGIGIEEGLVTRWVPEGALQPGPAGPNTALCLLLVAAALATLPRFPSLCGLCGMGAFVVAAGALLGYATGLDAAYTWASFPPIAEATAAAFLVLGAALGWQRAADPLARPGWHVPLFAGLGVAALAVLFFDALTTREDAQIESSVDATMYRIRAEIRSEIDERTNALSALAREWEDKIFRWRGAWESDARLVLSRSPGMDSIEWIKGDGKTGWTYPSEADHPPLVLPSSSEGEAPAEVWAEAVEFSDGVRGFRLAAALADSKGWLCGVFRAPELFEALSTALPSGYSIRLRAGKTTIYDNRPRGATRAWARTLPIQKGLSLSLTAQPSPGWLAQQRSFLPQVVLAAGLVFSFLLVWAMRAAQLSSARARRLDAEVEAHKRAEQQVRELNLELGDRVAQRTAALERTNRELKRFASFLSHELRQPVSSQALWADLLEAEYGASLDAQGQEYIAEIRRSVKRMNDLIAGQIALSEAASSQAELEIVDLASVVREVTSDLKPALEDAGAKVHTDEMPSVRGDSRQLYQLMRNLMDNSIKYRRRETPLELRLSSERIDGTVEILYEDNGRGFAPENAEKLFGVFERVGSREEGSGLGMALCRSIMERHGGTIIAEGRPGRGASFRMRFPAPPDV